MHNETHKTACDEIEEIEVSELDLREDLIFCFPIKWVPREGMD